MKDGLLRQKTLQEMIDTKKDMVWACWPNAKGYDKSDQDLKRYKESLEAVLRALSQVTKPGEILSVVVPNAFLPSRHKVQYRKVFLETLFSFSKNEKTNYLIHNVSEEDIVKYEFRSPYCFFAQ